MFVEVGDILEDRDSRRAGREVEVLEVHEDAVTIRTITAPGGKPVTDGVETDVNRSRLKKAYKHKFAKGGFVDNPASITYNVNTSPAVKPEQQKVLVDAVVEKVMKLAEPGNKVILDRLSALESRVNSSEYGGQGYWKPNVYCNSGELPSVNVNLSGASLDDFDVDSLVQNKLSSMTGSLVSNYPTIEDVLDKVLPQTESEEFEYLWDRTAKEDKNPHEIIIKMVYKLLTEY